MKNLSNIIFLDVASVLLPRKLSFFEDKSKSKKNKDVDVLAIKLLKQLHKRNNFNIVFLNKELDMNYCQAQKLILSYGLDIKLHEHWHVNYLDSIQTPFLPVSNWLKEHKVDNYFILLNSKYKFKLDFHDNSNVNFNFIHFIDEDNGLSLNNLKDIEQSLKLWI